MAMGSLATWPVKLIDSFVFFQEAMFFPRHLFNIGLIGFQALDLLTQDCIILLKFGVFLLDRLAKWLAVGGLLTAVPLPRIRYFRGVSPRAFDGRGNYTLGLKEQLMFP